MAFIGNNVNTYGINVSSNSIGFNPELRSGILYFEQLKLWEILSRTCGLISFADTATDGTMIDKVGSSGTEVGREAIQAQSVIGDGNTYIEFADFTDADLPDNYEIELEGVYTAKTGFNGFFGFDVGGSETFYFTSTDNVGGFRMATGLATGAFASGLSDNENFIATITITSTTLIVKINGDEKLNTSFSRIISNKPLQLFTIGEGSSVSAHNINSFKITDIDTGKYWQFIPESRDSLGRYQLVCSDGTSIIGQQFVSPATPIETNLTQISHADKYGYVKSDGVSFYYDEGLTLLIPVDTIIPVDENGVTYCWVAD